METLSLLIADGSEEFRHALSNALGTTYRLRCCHTGREALQQLQQEPPDILVLDLMLPELDGITLLYRAVHSGIQPMVLATSRLINDYIIQTAEELGVGYLILKPCDIRATVDRIHDLSQRIRVPRDCAPDSRTYASNMLTALGIPTKLKGYAYLREAILLMADSPMQSITKELYPAVGLICNESPVHIERSIRSAIATAWERRDDRVWNQYFPCRSDGSVPRPTNAAFISQLADRIMLEQIAIPLP